MVELTNEEERALQDLCDRYFRGESVRDYIDRRLHGDLSHVEDRGMGIHVLVPHDGFEETKQVYSGLADKGLLEGGTSFGNLTSAGRCFFADRAALEEAARKEKRSKRRHDWLIASYGIFGGLFSGALGAWLFGLIAEALER